ncbi:MAG: hypothetical protein Q8O14_14595 [bacterium]|nr:hypothetical protein [bacterium]
MKLFGSGTLKRGQSADSVLEVGEEMQTQAAALDAFSSETESDGIAKTWHDRGAKAWEYYQQEPIINNCINAWRTLAIGEDFTILASSEDLQKDVDALKKRLKLKRWLKDELLQLLTKGEAAAFKEYGGKEQGKTDDGKPLFQDFARVKVLNPLLLETTVKDGELTQVRSFTLTDSGQAADHQPVALEQFRRWLWDAPDFADHGTSMVLPAFESIELLRDYRRAERAIAKRWAMPVRLIKVGGQFGKTVVMPKASMLKDIKKLFDSMNARQGAVVPFYVTIDTYGAEGETLKTEEKVKESKSDIIVAMGFTRALVSGDGANFSTASLGFAKIQLMLSDLRDIAREMLQWVLDDWLAMRGTEGESLHIAFPEIDLSAGADQRKVLVDLYDRGLISVRSLQAMMGLSPDIEQAQSARESKRVIAPLAPGDIVGLAQQEMLTHDQVFYLLNLAERLKGAPEAKPAEGAPAAQPGDVAGLYDQMDQILLQRARVVALERAAQLDAEDAAAA